MSTLPNSSTAPRDFYRDALAQAFRYSGGFAPQTGRRAEDIVTSPAFQSILADARASSLDLARRIGDLAVVHLSAVTPPGPWWRDLLAYERAWFLQMASADQRLVTYFLRRGVAATTVNFTWDLPQLLERLRAGESVPESLRRSLTLLFSRAQNGKIYVIELDKPVAAVFRFTNGMRKKEQIAEAAGMPVSEVEEILRALAEIGAVENI
jgi:hypothetical protein